MWRTTVLGGMGGGALASAVLLAEAEGEGEAELDALGAATEVAEGVAEASDDAVGAAGAEDADPCVAVGRAPPAVPSLSDVGDAAGAHADAAVTPTVTLTIKPTKR